MSKEPPVVEFVIGTGDSDAIDKGSDEFIAHLLRDLRITTPIEKWSLTVCRASYYSEYPDSNDWEDHWPIGWLTRVELKAIPMRTPIPPEGFIGSDAIDMSYHHENHYAKLERVHCLVVADFEDEKKLEKARAEIEAGAAPGLMIKISVGEALGRFP